VFQRNVDVSSLKTRGKMPKPVGDMQKIVRINYVIVHLLALHKFSYVIIMHRINNVKMSANYSTVHVTDSHNV
jgi:hypothetical protein